MQSNCLQFFSHTQMAAKHRGLYYWFIWFRMLCNGQVANSFASSALLTTSTPLSFSKPLSVKYSGVGPHGWSSCFPGCANSNWSLVAHKLANLLFLKTIEFTIGFVSVVASSIAPSMINTWSFWFFNSCKHSLTLLKNTASLSHMSALPATRITILNPSTFTSPFLSMDATSGKPSFCQSTITFALSTSNPAAKPSIITNIWLSCRSNHLLLLLVPKILKMKNSVNYFLSHF